MISSINSKVRTTLYSIINSTTGKYGSVALLSIVTLQDFIHTLKLEPPFLAPQANSTY